MRRLPVFLLLISLLGAAPSSTGAEAGKATLTIHYRNCPYGYTHQEYFKLCHDRPLSNSTMGVVSRAGYIIEKTDGNGNLTLSLDPNTYRIFIGIASDFSADEYRFCTPTDQPGMELHGPLILHAGDDVTCDYYYVGGGGRSSPPSDDSLPPGAGHVRHFLTLTCDHDPGNLHSETQFYVPQGCRAQQGATLTVKSGDGQLIGSCVTEDSGDCALHVFVDVMILSEDSAAIPNGYAAEASPVLYQTDNQPFVIVNVPVSALPTVAPANSSITVHGRVCPPGYAGKDYFADCHGNRPDYSQMMFLQGELGGADSLAKTIDAEGNLTFSALLPEHYQLLLGLPSDTVSTYVACSKTGSSQTKLETQTTSSTGWSSTSILLGPGEDIVCDAYAIPPAA